MRKYRLNEDNLPKRLSVWFSRKINAQIDAIETYNQDNIDGLSQWKDYLYGLRSYISNPVIAWDYTNKYQHYRNGATYLNELGYNAIFMVMANTNTQQTYVSVFWINLKPEEFGLKVPPTLNENAQSTTKIVYHLKESQLRKIVKESIRKILNIA